VMEHPQHKDKDAASTDTDITRTREYRCFKKLLKRVVKAPPMRLAKGASESHSEPNYKCNDRT
jgi:hypothetical protein